MPGPAGITRPHRHPAAGPTARPRACRALGLPRSASTRPATMDACGTSSVAASSVRHGVSPGPGEVAVPGLVDLGQPGQHALGLGRRAASVTRRWRSAPSGLCDGTCGGVPGHQVTTGHVRHQQRGEHGVGVLPHRAVQAQQDRLARARLADPDLRVEAGGSLRAAGDHPQHPARVLAAGLARGPHRVVLRGLAGLHDEREHHAERGAAEPRRASGAPRRSRPCWCPSGRSSWRPLSSAAWLRSARARPRLPGRRYSRRQARPSRAISASAEAGPAGRPDRDPAWCIRPRSPRSGRGCATTARPLPAAGTAAGRRSARRAAAARRPRGWTR